MVSHTSPTAAAGDGGPSRKSQVSAPRRRLLALMQSVNFGRIEQLYVRAGEPAFDPRPRVVEEIKFACENGPRAEANAADFVLKAQVTELFAHCERIRDGVIESLVIKHGLPFVMSVEAAA